MKPTWKFMEFSFPKMEEIAFRRNPQGTSKLQKIAQVGQLRNKARKVDINKKLLAELGAFALCYQFPREKYFCAAGQS